MSTDQKALEDPPLIAVSSSYDEMLPADIVVRVGSYWSGKDLSTYLLAVSADDSKHFHRSATTIKLLTCLGERCIKFLDSVDAPASMKALLKTRMVDAIHQIGGHSSKVYMRVVSEWCAFLDYCEVVPLRLSESRLEQEKPIKPLWIVGAGEFRAPDAEPSPAILSVPSETWFPELIYLGEKWMVDVPESTPNLSRRVATISAFYENNIDCAAAVLSWKDSKYLDHIHHIYDISGSIVSHEFMLRHSNNVHYTCRLNWLSKIICENIPITIRGIRRTLGESKLNGWWPEQNGTTIYLLLLTTIISLIQMRM